MDHASLDTLSLLGGFCCLHHPGIGCSSGPDSQHSFLAEVISTVVLAPSVRAGDPLVRAPSSGARVSASQCLPTTSFT